MKVSIIIPIYMVEKELPATMDSVIAQSLLDVEIICIDDCSNDHCDEILSRYASQDRRIRVIHNSENFGTSQSRKIGVQASSGEYIMFLDGGDKLEENACKDLYAAISKKKVDVLQFETTIVMHEGADAAIVHNVEKSLHPYYGVLSSDEILDACFVHHKFSHTLWNKIYNGNVCRYAFSYVPDGRFLVGEDLFAFFLIAHFAKSYQGIKGKYYRYEVGTGISTTSVISVDKYQEHLRMARLADHLKEFIQHEGSWIKEEAAFIAVRRMMIGDCVNKWFMRLPKAQTATCFDLLIKAWGTHSCLSALARDQWKQIDQIADLIDGSPVLQPEKKVIKTIGTYYYRIANGGIERVISIIIPLWLKLGYRVVLLTDEDMHDEEYPIPSTVPRVLLPDARRMDNMQIDKRMEAWRQAIHTYEIDVVVGHAWISPILMWDILSIKMERIPYIQYTHGVFSCLVREADVGYNLYFAQLLHVYRLCDAVVTLSQANQAFWTCFSNKVCIIPNPTYLNIESVCPSSLESFNIVWIGRIAPEKCILDVVQIFQKVVDAVPHAELYIIGKADPDQAYLEQALINDIKKMNLEESVHLEGFHMDPSRFFENASIYLSTSIYEGYPMALVESKVFGVPCVMYELPYLELAQNPQGILTVKQGDIQGAADSIIQILMNNDMRKHMGQMARESVKRYTNTFIQNEWELLLDNLHDRTTESSSKTAQEVMLQTLMSHYQISCQQKKTSQTQTMTVYHGMWKKLERLIRSCNDKGVFETAKKLFIKVWIKITT